MSGKGDKRRPQQVSDEIMELRWKMAFGTDEERHDAKVRYEFIEWQNALNELDEYEPIEWGEKEK